MTFEHTVAVGLEEIRAIIFQCTSCKARMAIVPDTLTEIPKQCPNGHPWNTESPSGMVNSTAGRFVFSLIEMRKSIYEKCGFKILLEFDVPSNAK